MRMSVEHEQDLIFAAQHGDEASTLELLATYTPAINGGARAFARLIPERADAVQAATVGVINAINDYDPKKGARLAGIVGSRIHDELWAIASRSISTMNIPRTILARYFRVMSDERVRGNISVAREVASEYQISPATTHAVWAALNNLHVDFEPAADIDVEISVEDKVLSEHALASMAPLDRAVIEARYGFNAHRESTLEEVAEQLAITVSEARRAHMRGLASAREALGL